MPDDSPVSERAEQATLVKCEYCGARYASGVRLDYGYYESGVTTGAFVRLGTVPVGACPVCRRPLGEGNDG